MKKIIYSAIIATSTLVLASCAGSNSVDVAKTLNKSYEYDGKVIEVVGKVNVPGMVWGSSGRESLDVSLRTQSALDNTNVENIRNVKLAYGEGKNSIIINVAPDAKEYSSKDVVVYDKDGNKFTLDDEVTLKGKVTYTAKGPKKEPDHKIKIPTSSMNKDENKDNNDYSYTITEVEITKK